MSRKEHNLHRRIMARISETFGSRVWVFKVHGGPFQPIGLPDLIGCVDGKFFAIEVKHPDTDHDVTPAQQHQIDAIDVAQGHTCVAESVEEAIDFLIGLAGLASEQ